MVVLKVTQLVIIMNVIVKQ